jgi:hypothetical protein
MANKIWDIIIGNFGESTSLFGKLNKQDAYKILRTASLIGVGSALAYMTGALDTVEWGVSEAVILAGLTAATEAVQRLLKDNKGE